MGGGRGQESIRQQECPIGALRHHRPREAVAAYDDHGAGGPGNLRRAIRDALSDQRSLRHDALG